ncbi:MAG: MFS transporter [Anaerolineales bacterium]
MPQISGNRNSNKRLSDPHSAINPARVLFPLGLGTALSLMGDSTLYTVLPTHTADAGITLAAVGIILSANRLIRLFLNGPIGILYDRSSRRRLFIPAIFIGALSTAIYAAWSGFWPLLTGRLLWGLAWVGIWVGGSTIILDVTTDTDRGHWTGLYQTWFFLGLAIGAFTGGLLTDQLGYSSAMWIGAFVTVLGGLIALFFLPETRPQKIVQQSQIEGISSLRFRPNREMIGVLTLQGINRFVTAGVLAATLALLVQDQLNSSNLLIGVATLTGILLATRTILSMIAAPMAGNLSDRLGNRWGVTFASLVIGSIGMLLLVRSEPIFILIGICFSAIAGGSIQALLTTRTGDMVEQAQRGKAIGLLHTAGDLGSALGPVTAYVLLRWLPLSGVYIMGAIIFALGAVLALLMYLQQRNSQNLYS